ncbi:MAG: hypothetical protein M3378_04755 [Actinomycetota bacterium]|nr:hypothetical protein [Actinomycetota bacterium]MDQ3679849.1 hypothetical protein [Actinomycetota bacterium]
MSNLLYLLIPLAGSVVGSLVLWARNRKPTSVESGIDEFQRGLRALAPGGDPISGPGWRKRRRVS